MEISTACDESDMSDSSCELPELPTCFFEVEKPTRKRQKFLKGDIVWAKYKHLFWPALVRQVYSKAKKASIWYLDSPRKCFKVPFQKIRCFNNEEISEKIRNEVNQSPLKYEHEKVLSRVLTFLRRKGNGMTDDPGAFFQVGSGYLAAAYYGIKTEDTNTRSTEHILDATKKKSYEFSELEESPDSDLDRPNEYSNSESQDEDEEKTGDDELDKKTIELVNCIKSGEIDQYLLNIKQGSVSSERHIFYGLVKERDRKDLYFINSSGIVKNDKQLKEISDYVINLFKTNLNGDTMHSSDILLYVLCVWLPEAIVKAISITNSVKLEDAQKLFFSNNFLLDLNNTAKLVGPVLTGEGSNVPSMSNVCANNSEYKPKKFKLKNKSKKKNRTKRKNCKNKFLNDKKKHVTIPDVKDSISELNHKASRTCGMSKSMHPCVIKLQDVNEDSANFSESSATLEQKKAGTAKYSVTACQNIAKRKLVFKNDKPKLRRSTRKKIALGNDCCH